MGEYIFTLTERPGRSKVCHSVEDLRELIAGYDLHLIVYKSSLANEIDLIPTYARRGDIADLLDAMGKLTEFAADCLHIHVPVYVLRKMKHGLELYELYEGTEDGLIEALEKAADFLDLCLDIERTY